MNWIRDLIMDVLFNYHFFLKKKSSMSYIGHKELVSSFEMNKYLCKYSDTVVENAIKKYIRKL